MPHKDILNKLPMVVGETAGPLSGKPKIPETKHPLMEFQQKVGNRLAQAIIHDRGIVQSIDEKSVMAPAIRTMLGNGHPLNAGLRNRFETRLGPLGPVRIHRGPAADAFARRLNADAFCFGREIGLSSASPSPGTTAGEWLLMHELVHVKQAGDAPEPADGKLPIDSAGSAAERQAMRIETHGSAGETASQPAAMRLRRAAFFGLDWDIEHADVAGADTEAQLLGVYRSLTGVSTATARIQVPALVRLAGSNTGLLLSAFDFIRDNLHQMPRDLLGDMLLLAARFCGTRTDTVEALNDEFYRELLIAILYTPQPGRRIIEHSSGEDFPVPGVSAAERDFGATDSPTSLQRPAPQEAGHPIGGGFRRPLSLTVGFGTGARFPAAGVAEELVRAAGDRIDPRLLAAVQAVTQDNYVLRALRSFLVQDGGRLVAWDNDSGRYEGESTPPVINVGIAGGALDTRSTLVHELLHYVFDKTDSVLAEARDTGGADHPAIEAIETKFVIIDLIRSGRPPLHEKVRSMYGQFLRGEDFYPQMEEAIRDNDRTALFTTVNQSHFVDAIVSTGLLPTASGLPFVRNRDETYPYTPEQYRDLAFIWSQNAAIVRRAMNEAVNISGRLSISLADTFAAPEYQRVMQRFIRSYVRELQRDPRQGALAAERRI